VKEVSYASKGNSLQLKRERDDTNIFFSIRGSRCPGVATEYNLSENIEEIKVYAGFKMLEVKVPIIFSGTQGWTLVVKGPIADTGCCANSKFFRR
jgi:hypothetical protein